MLPSTKPNSISISTLPKPKMAIITEEPSPDHNSKPRLRKHKPNSEPDSKPKQIPTTTTNPFQFWFYFTLTVSLITLFFIILSSFSSQDPKSWFLDLPPILRQHYSNGRIIKVQTAPNLPQVEVFSIQQGSVNSDSHVLIVHGLGCSSFAFRNVINSLGLKNVHAVAIDLPGSGFSDKSVVVVEEIVGGNNGLWGVYEDIKEKGLFWGFDQLVEQGYVNVEENVGRVSKKESVRSVELGSEEMGRVLGQVVDTLGLVPVDLVLHDSALGLCGNWIAENRGLVKSVVILDGVGVGTMFPRWVLEMPVVSKVVLGFRFVFERVLGKCCVGSVGSVEADGHRILLKGRDGVSSVVGMGKKLNSSFDLSEWSRLDGVKDLPMRVVWSGGWSDEWTSEGRRVSDALPQATLVTHSGGRWIQEHNSEEVTESIHKFVSSLPKPSKHVVEEALPEHIQEMLHNDERSNEHHHHHHPGHGGHGHDNHGHAHAGYPDAYGLDHGWGM